MPGEIKKNCVYKQRNDLQSQSLPALRKDWFFPIKNDNRIILLMLISLFRVWMVALWTQMRQGGRTVCLVPLSTSITSGVRSCPQHLGWMISWIDSRAPPVAHCNDLSPPKLWPLVACVHEKNRQMNLMSLKVFDVLKNSLTMRNNNADYYRINP